MNQPVKITNHLPTAELQALDAAHHMHPFTDNSALAKKGARIMKSAQGVWLTDTEGHKIIDGGPVSHGDSPERVPGLNDIGGVGRCHGGKQRQSEGEHRWSKPAPTGSADLPGT